MPPLTRRGPRLLHVVNNKQHATEVDHHIESKQHTTALPTPPNSSSTEQLMTRAAKPTFRNPPVVQDFTQDPLSSDEEDQQTVAKPGQRDNNIEDFTQDPFSSDEDETSKARLTDLEKLSSCGASKSKGNDLKYGTRKRRSSPDSDSGGEIFGSLVSSISQQKRAKTNGGFRQAQRSSRVYGSQNSQTHYKPIEFKPAKAPIMKRATRETPTFKAARGADVFALDGPIADRIPSPSLSTLDGADSELEEVAVLDLSSSTIPKIKCEICHQLVDRLVKEAYIDEYDLSNKLNLKQQNAFCIYHKQNDAREEWQLRAYPTLDWDVIEEDMKAQHTRLVDILHGRIDSVFRDELERRLAEGFENKNKGQAKISQETLPVSDNEEQHELAKIAARIKLHKMPDLRYATYAGYFGPRGHKLMLEHISVHLADELRDASIANPLLQSAGHGGGVSGFVQGVLVPEMAVGLIANDMRVSEQMAHQILGESKELGEVLNDERRERVLEASLQIDDAISHHL